MKRDYDVMRSLLFQVEQTVHIAPQESPWKMFGSEGTHRLVINYHVRLLKDKGFFYPESLILDAKNEAGQHAAKFMHDALTNEGHEFLETIRDDDIWKKTKEGANSIGSFGFDLVKDLAKGFIKTEVKKRTGIDV